MNLLHNNIEGKVSGLTTLQRIQNSAGQIETKIQMFSKLSEDAIH